MLFLVGHRHETFYRGERASTSRPFFFVLLGSPSLVLFTYGPSTLFLSPTVREENDENASTHGGQGRGGGLRKRKRKRRMPSRPSSSRRPVSKSRSKPLWSEPPPGLFPTGAHDFLRLLAVLAIAAAAAAACSLLSRRPNPFCDSQQHYDPAYDSCEPCPQNGRCVHGKLECLQGFKKYGKICVEDGLLTQTANKISDLLRLTICDEHARALCGQSGKILFQQLDISNLADDLLSKDHAHLSDDGIKLVKDRVLESAHGFLEMVPTYNKVEAKCPELVAELHRPLSCQVRQWIFRNIISVVTSCILFAALLWILWSIYHRRAFSKRAEQIYEQVCEILEDNAMNAKIGNSECEPWVVTSWLRDHLLVTRERRNAVLWKKVEELILEDSRIDQYQKVIKGESKVVFEWQASGSLSGKIKKMQQGEGGISRRSKGVGAIRLGEEMDGSADAVVKDCCTRKEGTVVVRL